MTQAGPVLQVVNIDKAFPGVQALSRVSLSVFPGEVHAVVGENGAGKSTLMKIIFGVYQPDAGQILVDERPVTIRNPQDATNHGISIIFQELGLIPVLTIAENIFLNREVCLGPTPLIDRSRMCTAAGQLLERVGLNCSPTAPVASLSVAQAQMVSLAKALSYDARIIIMDEPTASLSQHEAENLFNIIHSVKQEGVSVIYISHRIEEVLAIADRITVLRDGQVAGSVSASEASRDGLITLMIGRRQEEGRRSYQGVQHASPLLEVCGATHAPDFRDVSFTLHRGEILGLAGLVGSGRTKLARALFGIERLESGTVVLEGKKVQINSPLTAIRHGIGFVPEDRKEQGLILAMSVRENITYPILQEMLQWFFFVNRRSERNLVARYIEQLGIKTPSMEQATLNLSGGNQQKTVLAKWLAINPKILILDEPTKGIDVGAKAEVHHLIREMAAQGVGVLLISSETPEILGMAHRSLVMYEGRLVGEFAGDAITEADLLHTLLGYGPGKFAE